MSGPKLRSPADDGQAHLTDSELAAFLDHALTAAPQRRVEAHLDTCAGCRGELVEMFRITDSLVGTSRSRRPWISRRWWVPAALAAGLAALLLVPRLRVPRESPTAPVRAPSTADGESELRIPTIAPADGATVPPGRLVFVWHAAAADVYRLSLLGESGQPVWSRETADTTATLPESDALIHAGTYFWRVDAIANGITASTGAHRLQIAP